MNPLLLRVRMGDHRPWLAKPEAQRSEQTLALTNLQTY